jgi:hypothetical protein
VYYGRPTPGRTPAPGDIVITRRKRLAEQPPGTYETLYEARGVVLARIKG